MGEPFAVADSAGARFTAVLAEVRSLGFNRPVERGGRESFGLLFHAPGSARYHQGIHAFEHPRLGRSELFLVPLGPDATGMRLEVIFNFT